MRPGTRARLAGEEAGGVVSGKFVCEDCEGGKGGMVITALFLILDSIILEAQILTPCGGRQLITVAR